MLDIQNLSKTFNPGTVNEKKYYSSSECFRCFFSR